MTSGLVSGLYVHKTLMYFFYDKSRSSIVVTPDGEITEMCGCGAGMYELQLPQSLFDICHKFPADTNQWLLTATNDKGQLCNGRENTATTNHILI